MKYALTLTIGMLMFFSVSLGFSGIRETATLKQKYKDAIDAGTDAAAKYTTYLNEENLYGLSNGFGEGYKDSLNIQLDKEESLKWFYRVFFRNMGIDENTEFADQVKKYIPIKALIGFDRVYIANEEDVWIEEKPFNIEYNGQEYLFTLSNQIKDLTTDTWLNINDIGLNQVTKDTLLNQFIKDSIERAANNRTDKESELYYTINIGMNENDPKFTSIQGVSFVVLVEGLPIPSKNLFNPSEKFYAFSIGGSQIIRKN
jgi:hypothetical protein